MCGHLITLLTTNLAKKKIKFDEDDPDRAFS